MPEPRPFNVSFAFPQRTGEPAPGTRHAPHPRAQRTAGSEPPRLTIALTFDFDAFSAQVDRGDGPYARSTGEYGVRVGLPRVLGLLARHEIHSTFFVPGHAAATFPASVAAIVAGGHELACHGWVHEDVACLGEAAERDILIRSREALQAVSGRPPIGYRAPFWSLSERTLGLVEEAGFGYDSSLAWDDFRLSRVRHDDRHERDRSVLGPTGRLVEVPVSRLLADWLHFEPGPGAGGGAAPSAVEEIWLEELRYAHASVPGGLITFTLHPETIGRGSRIAMLERLISAARELPGVVFSRLDVAVASWVVTHGA